MKLNEKQYGKYKVFLRMRRKVRIRKKILGSSEIPRVSVYRSLKHIYVQAIDDTQGKTLASASTVVIQNESIEKKVERARKIGEILGRKLRDRGILKVIFDRNGFSFSGRVAALADGARKEGLKF
ncbi:MAG: 50S ribosomal protein L18 [Deltaproteobacteria bacterium]|nr:MAG: 50S ribosomal protein L18 [Deltaproteobacteria bacterium]